MNSQTRSWILAAAAVLFAALIFWTWRVLIPIGAVNETKESSNESNLPPLEQNVVFTKPKERPPPQKFVDHDDEPANQPVVDEQNKPIPPID